MLPLKHVPGLIAPICYFLLIFLWVYAAISKLADYEHSRVEMLNQALPHQLELLLVWAVPLTELVAAALLLFSKTRIKGIILSLFLLITFTVYIALVKLDYFGLVPCSCGGIISQLSWGGHFVFNMVFILIAGTVLLLETKKDIICK